MTTDAELKTYCEQFADPVPISTATSTAFGFVKHPMTATWTRLALDRGLLEWWDGDGPVVDGNSLFVRHMLLTAIGRQFCNLPPLVKAVSKPKAAQGSLFE